MRIYIVCLVVASAVLYSCQKELSVELPNGPVNPPPADSSFRLSGMSWWSLFNNGGNSFDTTFVKFEYYDSVKTVRILEGSVYVGGVSYYDSYRQFNDQGYLISETVDYDTVPTPDRFKNVYSRNALNQLQSLTYQSFPGSTDIITYSYRTSGPNTIIRFADTLRTSTNGGDYYDLTINPDGRVIKVSYLDYGTYDNNQDVSYQYDAGGNLVRSFSTSPSDTVANKTYSVVESIYERDDTKKSLVPFFAVFSGKEYSSQVLWNIKPAYYYDWDDAAYGTPLKKITSRSRYVENGVLINSKTGVMTYENTYDVNGNLIQINKFDDGKPVERIYLKYKKYKN